MDKYRKDKDSLEIMEIFGSVLNADEKRIKNKAVHYYNAIDYKNAFHHIRVLADLEWNGKITITNFRERLNEIISVVSEKESKW